MLAPLYAGELCTGPVITLGAAKEKITALYIPSEEVLVASFRNGCTVGHVNSLAAETLPVTRKFSCIEVAILVIKTVRINILLTVDRCGVAGGITGFAP